VLDGEASAGGGVEVAAPVGAVRRASGRGAGEDRRLCLVRSARPAAQRKVASVVDVLRESRVAEQRQMAAALRKRRGGLKESSGHQGNSAASITRSSRYEDPISIGGSQARIP
jgi:hypothetical protein